MFLKILIVSILLIYLFSRFSGFIFRWIFKIAGDRIYKKALKYQQQQAASMQRQREGFRGQAMEKNGMTILVPKEDQSPKPNRTDEDDDGEYVNYEEVK